MNDIIRGSLFAGDPLLRNAVTLGQWLDGPPCLLDMELLKLPGHILGPIGTGKSVCLRSIMRQLMMRQSPFYREFASRRGLQWEPVSIVYVTFVQGPDDREFNYLAEGAELAGMEVKVFIPRPGRRSHVYNPYLQSFLRQMGSADIAEHFGEAGDFLGNEIYGPKYFGTKDFRVLIRSVAAGWPFSSYWGHAQYLEDDRNDDAMGLSDRDRRAGDQVMDHMGIMGTIHPFNEHPRPGGPPQSVFDAAIDFGSLYRTPQFVYVNLDWLGEKRGHTIAKHMLFDAKKAAQVLDAGGRPCRVFFIVDEAQSLVKSEGVMGIFDRVRHRNLSLILAHQYAEQLSEERGGDFSKGVSVNFPWGIDFSLPTPDAIERMQKYAPDDLRHSLRFPIAPASFDRDEVARAVALTTAYEMSAEERWEPRYSKNTVMALTATNRVGWLRARFNSGVTRVSGIAPFVWSHAMPMAQWDGYADLCLPLASGETVAVLKEGDFDPPPGGEGARLKPSPRKPRNPRVLRAPEAAGADGDAELARKLSSMITNGRP